MSGKFRNPYNFVPLRAGKICDQLEQGEPAGHHRYHDDLWSGRIEIDIETVTPLLIPDAANVEVAKESKEEATKKGHKTFDVRRGLDGRPLLPVTTLKGMLRSAYEMVTNSRFGVFKGHEAPPARRMHGTEGAAMVPARVVKNGDGFAVELWKGMSAGWPELVKAESGNEYYAIKNNKAVEHLYAAWLPSYKAKEGGMAKWACRLTDTKTYPEHGLEVYCWVESMRQVKKHFKYWRVREIATDDAALSPKPPLPSPEQGSHVPSNPSIFRKVRGFVFVSEQNTENKHDERVFFVEDEESPTTVTLSSDVQRTLKKRWAQLVENYQALHKKEIEERGGKKHAAKFIKPEPGKVAFSRHVFSENDLALKIGTPFDCEDVAAETGTLCYAQLKMVGGKVSIIKGRPIIEALYPVMISRELGYASPKQLLPNQWHPANGLTELSPADRVFGWVQQNSDGEARGSTKRKAYKGQLRISEIKCDTEASEAIETFDEPLPLTILGEPKISQARFYVGKAATSEPLATSVDTGSTAYFDRAVQLRCQLRGNKVFPHQALTVKTHHYWNAEAASADAASGTPMLVTNVNGQEIYREYVRHPGDKGNKDQQNRSIKAWVKPETKFTASIDVVNLNDAELGVLLWLLDLQGQNKSKAIPYHRLGGGKPLGFGSVSISIRKLDLATGIARSERYRSLFGKEATVGLPSKARRIDNIANAKALIDISNESGTHFSELPQVAAFLRASMGYHDNIPTHYPRKNACPDPAGKNYEWFVANEREPHGGKYALPALEPERDEDSTLPLAPD